MCKKFQVDFEYMISFNYRSEMVLCLHFRDEEIEAQRG